MDRTFTSGEFYFQVFGPDKLNTDFLDEWGNKWCIKSWTYLTPLRWAAEGGYLDVVRYLVENVTDLTVSRNRTAIRGAIIYRHLDIVKYLLSTYMYSDENIHYYARYVRTTDEIKELLINYKQFSNTKACR